MPMSSRTNAQRHVASVLPPEQTNKQTTVKTAAATTMAMGTDGEREITQARARNSLAPLVVFEGKDLDEETVEKWRTLPSPGIQSVGSETPVDDESSPWSQPSAEAANVFQSTPNPKVRRVKEKRTKSLGSLAEATKQTLSIFTSEKRLKHRREDSKEQNRQQ